MAEKRQKEEILSDSPLADPAKDKLGYAEFARHLSRGITRMIPEDGFVMAIYGEWGSGKTTLLNFVQHYLAQEKEAERPIVIQFNPWWFMDDEALIRRFFSQLETGLAGGESKLDTVRANLGKLAQALSKMPDIPWFPANSLARTLLAMAVYLLQARTQKVDVVQLKELIAKDLRNLGQKIVVIIDDIDRLTGEEVRQLFRIVKAVGNFPYVTYVLAFDKEVVARALEGVQEGISGEQYLEKIVQVPLPLPAPEAGSVNSLLFEKLDALIAHTSEDYFENDRWALTYNDALKPHMRTPRDVVRLVNVLQLTYPILEDNVNVVDFIGISFLGVYYPGLYQLIRDNPDVFAGAGDRVSPSGYRERDEQKPFHEKWLQDIDEAHRGQIKELVIHLFPKLDGILGNTLHSGDDWEKQLRVCSPAMFPIYFRLAIPAQSISNKEMRSIIALGQSAQAFGDRLVELTKAHRPDKTTRLRGFLERMESYTREVVPTDHIAPIIEAFFMVGDQLSPEEDEPRGMFDFDNNFRIVRVIHQLLKRLEPAERFAVLQSAIKNGQALSRMAHQVGVYALSTEKEGEGDDERTFTDEQIPLLRNTLVEKIREFASQNTLAQTPDLNGVLYAWKRWAGVDEPKAWAQEYIKSDANLAHFLESFSTTVTSGDMRGLVSHRLKIDPQWIEPFVDPASIVERVKSIASSDSCSQKQRDAAQEFLKEYELRSQGLDPNNPLAERELKKDS